jgi:hypothetical protein
MFEGHRYGIGIDQTGNEFLVWTETWDDWDWYRLIQSTEQVGTIKHPVKVVRYIERVIKSYIYQNRLPYFQYNTHDSRLMSIYDRFVRSLSGYTMQICGQTRWVFRDQ